MSNPIAANVEYLIRQGHDADQPRPHHSYHHMLRKQQEQQLRLQRQQVHEHIQVEESRWNFFRRMSIGVQPLREEGDGTEVTPTSEYFETPRIHLQPPMLGEEENLPSIEDYAKENRRYRENRTNYFEHPFESLFDWPPQGATKVSPVLLPIPHRPVTKPHALFDPLLVTIRDVDHSVVYHIDLQYGEIKWTVKRSIHDFYELWYLLKVRSGIESPPSFPSKIQNLANAISSLRSHEQSALTNGDLTSLGLGRSEKRRAELEQYLREVVQKAKHVDHLDELGDLCEFLEISANSIVKDMGWKGKEGYVEQRVATRSANLFRSVRRSWVKRWIILRDSYIAFCKDTASESPIEVMLFDDLLRIDEMERKTFSSHIQISLSNRNRRIIIRLPKGADEWLANFAKVRKESPWAKTHRMQSFAPPRENCKAKWFVDGHEYFEAVAEAILSAKSDIFIEDWWLSPQLYLRRPPKGNEEYRIDRLLKRKAAIDGVKIYIVIYKSMSVALPLDSHHTKHWLQDAHPNIVVLRHANRTKSAFWAHHEKILVIDHRLAFVGGLDLCFGRYDTHTHDLTDYAADDEAFPEIFPGQDYSNPRIKDFIKVSQYELQTVDKRRIARMPWHDIHTGMVGPPARDIARHFIQRWNFIKSTTHARDRPEVPYLLPKGEYVSSEDERKFRGTCKVQVLRSSAHWSSGIEREHSIYNAYMECITKAKHFIYIENQFFITTADPTSDKRLIKNKIGQAIVNRIIRAHKAKKKFRVIVVIPSAPGFEGDFSSPDRRSMPLRSVAHYQYMSISRGSDSVLEKLRQAKVPAEEYIGFYSLRNWGRVKTTSATPLSSGIKEESPLGSAATVVGSDIVGRSNSGKRKKGRSLAVMATKNTSNSGIATDEVVRRQPRMEFNDARMEYVTEQVYIHSKLMIVDDKTVICGSANLNDRSQLGNRDSEIATVIEDTDTVPSRMNGLPYNASRFALTLRMQLFKEHLGVLDSNEDMKRQDTLAMDPLHDEFYYGVWNKIAKANTDIYRNVFRCVPDDTVSTFEEHRRFVPDPMRISAGHVANPWSMNEEQIQTELSKIRGHLVTFPIEYLNRESMIASLMQEAVPPQVFT
ncbi:hypothetical protein BJV82DRAFT_612344 [Fennellomyces sp. T-0311]|nr:hypothetical protein BJV82DRAFT_612344 [Fennellomyces sp. T-0311]